MICKKAHKKFAHLWTQTRTNRITHSLLVCPKMLTIKYLVLIVLISILINNSYSRLTTNAFIRLFETAVPYLRFYRVQIGNRERCIDELGCFRNEDLFFHPTLRPLSVVPESREKIDTRFYLYTRKNSINPENITANVDHIKSSCFVPKKKTVFIIHGFYFDNFFGQYQQGEFKELVDSLLSEYDANVIFVDWGRGASTWYVQATANARVVGAEIALMVNRMMKEFKMKGDKFWIIGHSLGGHIAGYAGERIDKLGRITGLDPAKPYFENMPLAVRLDPSDAVFVDVIHTNVPSLRHPFGFGTGQILGDIDYYPNTGNGQPGCLQEKLYDFMRVDLAHGLRRSSICNHGRSISFMTETLKNKKCKMFAFKCANHVMFQNGHCWKCGAKKDNCKIVGNLLDTKGHKYANLEGYHLLTNSEDPYCVFQYRISFEYQQLSSCALNRPLKFNVTLHGAEQLVSGQSRLLMPAESSKEIAFVVSAIEKVDKFKEINFEWIQIKEKIKREHVAKCRINFSKIKVIPMNMWSDHLKDKFTQKVDKEIITESSTIYNIEF